MILLLFNLLAIPRITQRQVVEVDYGTFMSMTESGEVGRAEIQEQENRILFTNKEETTVYKTAMVEDPDLTERLHDAGVPFYGQEIQQESPILSFLLTWILPLVVFIAIGQFMSKKLMDRPAVPTPCLWIWKVQRQDLRQIFGEHQFFRCGGGG